jgi:hypothetical protein
MLSRCANSQCSRPFLRLHQGKLFLVETDCMGKSGKLTATFSAYTRQQLRHVERDWLCDQCAEVWTLVQDREQGIELVPLPRLAVLTTVARAEEYRESA